MPTDRFPEELNLNRSERTLTVVWDDGRSDTLDCEFLRVHSPSAEVKGHGKEVLQTGKKLVNINAIEPVGQYAVKIVFDDGHQTGLYSWDYLRHLGDHRETLWQTYLSKLSDAGARREPDLIGRWNPAG
jgi:DUF971 family protein